jgi:hypothetical protein
MSERLRSAESSFPDHLLVRWRRGEGGEGGKRERENKKATEMRRREKREKAKATPRRGERAA